MFKLVSVFFGSLFYMASCFNIYASDRYDIPETILSKRKRSDKEMDAEAFEPSHKKKLLQASEKIKDDFSVDLVSSVDKEQQDPQELILSFSKMPDELLLDIFKRLPLVDMIQASQVCKQWHRVSEDPLLWKEVRLTMKGDYLEHEATKENAKLHWLRVLVNTLSDIKRIEYLVRTYHLNIDYTCPYLDIKSSDHMGDELGEILSHDLIKEKAAQGNEEFIHIKIIGMLEGRYGYEKDYEAACAYHDDLMKQGIVIWRGDRISPSNFFRGDCLVQRGKVAGIQKKIEELLKQGYKQNPQGDSQQEAVNFNERLIDQGNTAALRVKIEGLAYGLWGYRQDPQAAVDLNDFLIEQGDREAIERKLEGLRRGGYGYQRDRAALHRFREDLTQKGSKERIKSDIYHYFYEGEDNNDLRYFLDLNNQLAEEGDEEAVATKIDILVGYHDDSIRNPDCYGGDNCLCDPLEHNGAKDLEALSSFIDRFIERGSKTALERKVGGILFREDMYEEEQNAIKNWIEEEEYRGKRWAYYFKSQGLKYGLFGFKQNREEAKEYIWKYHIPFYLKNFPAHSL